MSDSNSTEMGIYEAMSTLRAVRRLRPDPIPDATLEKLVQAASWAPTGANNQPWRVIVVRDSDKKKGLEALYAPLWNRYAENAKKNVAKLPEERREGQLGAIRAGDYLASHMHEAPAIFVFVFNPALMTITDRDQARPSVVGGGSVYPSVQNLLLAARAEGLGCVLTTLLCMQETEVKTLLEIPDDWHTCAAVPVGLPVARGHGPIRRRAPSQLAFGDTFGQPIF